MPLLMKDIKPGDKLKADGGFTCIEESRVCEVKADAAGELYVDCCGSDGEESQYGDQHMLSGQCDDGVTVIGFERVPA